MFRDGAVSYAAGDADSRSERAANQLSGVTSMTLAYE